MQAPKRLINYVWVAPTGTGTRYYVLHTNLRALLVELGCVAQPIVKIVVVFLPRAARRPKHN
ncbi:uncharacterized protein BDW43DRAFT_264264 [Aspergillus alliaceus]|uniref:uncharacterized protein n=1 Tax=Petromyces alliaceus TaxID=209559 RepID=UPI0012A49EEC|nr:uncharacterized protein BDW43DRAFT_264264 [Aspergillus alliaceus]KAB8237796.1 hypothetical protein BDW43DRAFT_264264 [Aspergillus alliaceus]